MENFEMDKKKYYYKNIACLLTYKWCFINKVREEHDQIINRFGTGATRLANHPNEHNAYIYIIDIACLPPSSDSFPASLLHPNSSPLIYFIPHQGRGSSLGSGHVPGSEPSPRTASQNMLTIAIRLNVRVNSWNIFYYMFHTCHSHILPLWHLLFSVYFNIIYFLSLLMYI